MVRLTGLVRTQMKTFGFKMNKKYNHRVPIAYQKFQKDLNPEEIVAFYSREDFRDLDPIAKERSYKDAQETMGRKNFLLPNLSDQDRNANDIFQQELDRQRGILARIEKIKVHIDSQPGKDTELMMNRNISTPYDCARHVNEFIMDRSIVAEVFPGPTSIAPVDDKPTTQNSSSSSENEAPPIKSIYWDMHRPLEGDCRLKFRRMDEENVAEVNKAYWRSCSFLLGMAARLAFKDDIKVLLHSWPKPNPKSGSFVYDVALNLSEQWKPNESELRAFTKVLWSIKEARLPFERLQVKEDVAKRLFANNPFKTDQIDAIAQASDGKVVVYRCGGLLDISIGPMISNTAQIGRISLASVHSIAMSGVPEECKSIFYRFQGVSLPMDLPLSSFVYQNIIINNAKKLNKTSL